MKVKFNVPLIIEKLNSEIDKSDSIRKTSIKFLENQKLWHLERKNNEFDIIEVKNKYDIFLDIERKSYWLDGCSSWYEENELIFIE